MVGLQHGPTFLIFAACEYDRFLGVRVGPWGGISLDINNPVEQVWKETNTDVKTTYVVDMLH